MRIIGGKFRGRKFYPPATKWPTRPTTDFAKEGLFNMLNNRLDFEDLVVLDLFGGTGNHSYEFISRGCEDVTYVDQFIGCVKFATQTSKTLEVEDNLRIVRSDVFKFIKTTPKIFDYIFAGPPYDLPKIQTIPDEIFKFELLKKDGLLVVEHDKATSFESHPNFQEDRKYGKNIFSFFQTID